MTENEERNYLCELILASSQWRISEGDETDAIRLEVQDRLRRLNGVNTVDENGYCQSEPDNLPAEDEALTGGEHIASVEKVREARSKWERDKVRVYIDGKHVWKPRAQCVKQPRDNSKGGAPWKWVWIGPQDKQKQCDAMWAEHEQENN